MSDFIKTFLFGENPIAVNDGVISAFMDMDAGKEGWVGIPHGGIGMGAILDLLTGTGGTVPDSVPVPYPMTCAFRMGGAEARGGDRVTVSVQPSGEKMTGQILVQEAHMPYITAEISCNDEAATTDDYTRSYVPDGFSRIEGRMQHLPHYLNCFVCGVDRRLPGLKRRFHLWESDAGRVVCAFAGFNEADHDTFFRFSRNGVVHPMALLAVLDETMGWSGFFAAGHGGVSVRLNYHFLRELRVDEKLVFFARGEKVMGRIDKRMFFWASGCGVVVKEDGSFEKVAESSGQWYAMAALTEQMQRELIPEALTRKTFDLVTA